jgi:hypothetical protein
MKNSNPIIKEQPSPPEADLFIATGCAFCPLVMNELSSLLKAGKLSVLKITNIAVNNERASQLNIRSVPWFSLSNTSSSMVFSGNYSAKEIAKWVEVTQSGNAMVEYIENFLASGEIMTLVQAIQLAPDTFSSVIDMLKDENTSMDLRIGLDALLENFAATETLKQHAATLKKMASEDNIRIQIDALHYLALTGDINNKHFLEEKSQHHDKQIQEAAIEALETLNNLLE